MKILFVVCGEGLGHASRCLHLGHYMEQQGHTLHFAGYGKSYDFMEQNGCTNLHKTPREVYLEGDEGFFSLKKTLLFSKWIPYNLLKSALRVRRLLKVHRFDCWGDHISKIPESPVHFYHKSEPLQREGWKDKPGLDHLKPPATAVLTPCNPHHHPGLSGTGYDK